CVRAVPRLDRCTVSGLSRDNCLHDGKIFVNLEDGKLPRSHETRTAPSRVHLSPTPRYRLVIAPGCSNRILLGPTMRIAGRSNMVAIPDQSFSLKSVSYRSTAWVAGCSIDSPFSWRLSVERPPLHEGGANSHEPALGRSDCDAEHRAAAKHGAWHPDKAAAPQPIEPMGPG